MGLKDLHRKLTAFWVRQFLKENVESNREGSSKPSWMTPISHGFHVAEDRRPRVGSDDSGSDSVVVQREQVQDQEVWMFGVFDAQMGDGVTKYLQSHLFDKNPNEIRRKSKEAMKKAYLSTRAKIREEEKANLYIRAKIREEEKAKEITRKMGAVSAIVINGEKVVTAYMDGYRAIICRDGVANQIGKNHQRRAKSHWSLNQISGVWHMPRVRILASDSGDGSSKPSKSSKPILGVEEIDSDAEFVILASNGIWEVLNDQEAVNLIRHIEDPQEATECLAKEASTRMSKSNISCLVIRFD